ncbi:hypothetical protein RsS62_23560 [Rhizobium dioscoreae]|uniref:DUF7674 family protein n=1 Tax=Rhizobium TaxID=379 RepID=UPI0011AA9CB2|nr:MULTISPECIES: hypothetical protein [Rhizobium]GES43104.1 hypothetical protein RsS62_23560 [Rhizobium dioscoreae]
MTLAICVAFTAGLAFTFKPLEGILSEHLRDNSGEILPHLLMADYCRLVEKTPESHWIKSFLAYLEENFSSQNDPLSELISVSFIEHLSPGERLPNPVVKLLGKRMRDEYRRIFSE